MLSLLVSLKGFLGRDAASNMISAFIRGCQQKWRARFRGASREDGSLIAIFLAVITLASGILNLISVLGGASQPKLLVTVFPLEFSHTSRALSILMGFALIVSSLNIYKRKKRAWAVVLALSVFSTIFHLIREPHNEQVLLWSALVLLLLLTRDIFTVKSGRPDLRSALVRLLVSGAAALGYGIAGFWLLDERHFGMNFRIGDAIAATLRFLSLSSDPRLSPHTQFGHWFLDSLYLITMTASIYACFALFRPMLYHFRTAPRERALARKIVQHRGLVVCRGHRAVQR